MKTKKLKPNQFRCMVCQAIRIRGVYVRTKHPEDLSIKVCKKDSCKKAAEKTVFSERVMGEPGLNPNLKNHKMRNKQIEKKIISDLKAGKIDGILTAEIAKRYGISVGLCYRFMLGLCENGFTDASGRMLVRNSGDENQAIRHTHWFFT